MTTIVENRAAQKPASMLTPTQQNAMRCLAAYKHQKRAGNNWWIGNFRFSVGVIAKLEAHKLVRERRHTFGPYLQLTTAGEIAAERLKRGQQ